MGDTGLEPANENACKISPNQTTPKISGALSGALSDNSEPNLPAELVKMLSGLSAEDKAKLADMLKGQD